MLLHHHPKTLSSLTPNEQAHLAQLLTLPAHDLNTTGQPSKAWLATQSHLITDTTTTTTSTIPTALRGAPQSLLARFLGFVVTTTTPAPLQRAVLCPAHRGLNNRLVRAVFELLTAEVGGGKARPLRRFARHPGRYHLKEGEGKVVCALVDRLAGLEGLWSCAPPVGPCAARKYRRFVESGCEACILAIVGGDEDVLSDLWAVVVGRTHRRRQKGAAPVFGELIAAWIENSEDGQRVKREADALGKVVKRVRRAVWKHRREKGGTQSVNKRKRKARSGHVRVRDSGYGSVTGNVGDLAAWKAAGDRSAALIYHSSSSSLREKGRDGCGDDDPFVQTAVEYDVLLRKRDTLSRCQPEILDPDISTHYMAQNSSIDEPNEEYDVFLRKRSPAAYQYQQPHASDPSSSSSSTLHVRPPSISEGADEYDADDDDSDCDKDQPNMWHSTRMQDSDAEFDPAFGATRNSATKVSRSGSLRNSPSNDAMSSRPLTRGLVDGLSQGEEAYDPAQWTDVTVATQESRWRGDGPEGVAERYGSSSVYSTTETAVPHPPVIAASTLISSNGLRRALASREELAWSTWPNPFAEAPPITTITHSNVSKRFARTSSSSSSRTVASRVVDSNTTASLSPDDFQKALERLEELSIVDTGKENTLGIPEGTVLPWESVSVVGRCICTAYLHSETKKGGGGPI